MQYAYDKEYKQGIYKIMHQITSPYDECIC